MLLALAVLCVPSLAAAEDNIGFYGMKGYAFTYSPLVSDGLHLQTGGMYHIYHEHNLKGRDGYIWDVPVSVTYGDGDWWEASVASHYEYWKNTDYDVDEEGIGDIFVGGKLRLLGQERGGPPLDVSIMPFVLFGTGGRDDSIGDLYHFNPTDSSDHVYGLNALLGRRWDRLYLSFNAGMSYMDTDLDYIKSTTFFLGLAAEYQISESWSSYVEFINMQNRNELQPGPYSRDYDDDVDDDIRELGAGVVWLLDKWAFKLHAGAGFTDTSPDFRGSLLINRLLFY